MNPNDSNRDKKSNEPVEPISSLSKDPVTPVEPIEVDVNSSPSSIAPPFPNPADASVNKQEKGGGSESEEKIEKVEFKFKKEGKTHSSEELKNSTNGMQETIDYIKQNKVDLSTYFFLLVGFLFLILGDFFVGSLIIGLTAGYHFSYEIVFYLRNLNHIFEGHEHLRFLVITAVIVGLFLSIPGMFVGAIIAAVFKHVIYDK